MLSTSDLRRWFLAKTRRGKGKHVRASGGEFATYGFLRAVGLGDRAFYKWLHGHEEQPRYMLKMMSHFVEDWENGRIMFSEAAPKSRKRRDLVRLEQPRKMPTRMAIDLSGNAPKLQFRAKPNFERMPDFPSLVGPLSVDAKTK